MLGYRINLTPSEPLGLWRIVTLNLPATVGDVVFICPPQTAAMKDARDRGYLRSGLCPGGYAPLIKTIVATEGTRLVIDRSVTIDGRALAHSDVRTIDGSGRTLFAFAGSSVPAGEVFVHSPFVASFDSRYFGPIPASGILGRAEEVLTFAP
ncbi:conjugative transfer signal peptidase TraF [Rhizobium sp. BK251]|uniref:conjugative transfer signal peptidase TraF n=1 Tax=Rhizobium sp. BK251 TaxID=2512125 RepID=UPI001FE199CB|nr:conjugative transfer signal peptidase TraF [Rhizobium sp. BK251]